MNEKRKAAGQKLLDAAHKFWQACRDEGQYGAIQWLEGSNGELVLFTRGEYRQHLLNNVHSIPGSKVLYFQGEVMPPKETP